MSSRGGRCQGPEPVFQLFPGPHSKTIAQKNVSAPGLLAVEMIRRKIDPSPGVGGTQLPDVSLMRSLLLTPSSLLTPPRLSAPERETPGEEATRLITQHP